MKVLAFETSCDDTAVAIYDDKQGLLAHRVHSQNEVHRAFGGVVPELASRDHALKLLPLLLATLREANCSLQNIDLIAYTRGPGLSGALLVGSMFAKSLGLALSKPTLGVHHLEGHILAPFLESQAPTFPFLALLVSGGHTQLIHVKALGEYEVIGESLDDAAGEAFDKVAKLLGFPYPGGPALAALADQSQAGRYRFTLPLSQDPYNFSFSGLKTAVMQAWRVCPQGETDKAEIAYAFQETVIESLVRKATNALTLTGVKQFVIAGGVSANRLLRERVDKLAKDLSIQVFYPRLAFCTDNAAMIAYAACQYAKQGKWDASLACEVKARWAL